MAGGHREGEAWLAKMLSRGGVRKIGRPLKERTRAHVCVHGDARVGSTRRRYRESERAREKESESERWKETREGNLLRMPRQRTMSCTLSVSPRYTRSTPHPCLSSLPLSVPPPALPLSFSLSFSRDALDRFFLPLYLCVRAAVNGSSAQLLSCVRAERPNCPPSLSCNALLSSSLFAFFARACRGLVTLLISAK